MQAGIAASKPHQAPQVWYRQNIVIAVVIAIFLMIVGGIVTPGFLAPSNLLNILAIASLLGIAAAGQTLVILAGGEGIDLSVGATITLASVITSQISNGSNGKLLESIVIALAVGLGFGLINGLGIHFTKIPPLVMTLGMSSVIEGAAVVYTQGQPRGQAPGVLAKIGTGELFHVPWLLLVWVILAVLVTFVLKRMNFGRLIFLLGANRSAGRFSGIPVTTMTILVYGLSGLLGALAGVLFLGYVNTTYLNLGDPYVLPTVAAVVIGGTALSGGRGGYWGTVVGAIILTELNSILIPLHMGDAMRQIVNGVVLLLVLTIYSRGHVKSS